MPVVITRSYKCLLLLRRSFTFTHARVYCDNSQNSEIPVLTLFTKPDCSLCDEAMDVLKPHLHKVKVESVNISKPENEEWYRKYRYDIPVFHLNGKYLMKHRADIEKFLQALKKH